MEPKKNETQEEVKEEKIEEEKVEEKIESQKEDFEKESEVVSAGKYNQALRKQREIELEKKELEKKLAEVESTKTVKEEPDEVFKEEEKPDISSLVDERVKPILERLNQKEENDKKVQRTTFFTKHPEYLKNSEKWQELLDEVDNSLNPHSKDSYYQQLEKAHRIIAVLDDDEIDKKKRELASNASSKGDGASKTETKGQVDERAERLAKSMPVGYEFKKSN